MTPVRISFVIVSLQHGDVILAESLHAFSINFIRLTCDCVLALFGGQVSLYFCCASIEYGSLICCNFIVVTCW